jgi:hypothetical protein
MMLDYEPEMINYDGVIYHAALYDYYSEGKIKWLDLNGRFGIRIK